MIYFEAWTIINRAKNLEKSDKLDAINQYQKAKHLLEEIQRTYPKWKSHIISEKKEKIKIRLENLSPSYQETDLSKRTQRIEPQIGETSQQRNTLSSLRRAESENITLKEALKQSRIDYQKSVVYNTQLEMDLKNSQEKEEASIKKEKIWKKGFKEILFAMRKKRVDLTNELGIRGKKLEKAEFENREKKKELTKNEKEFLQAKLQNEILQSEYNEIFTKFQNLIKKNVSLLLKKSNDLQKNLIGAEREVSKEQNPLLQKQIEILKQENLLQNNLLKEFKESLNLINEHSLSKQILLKEEEIQILRIAIQKQIKEHQNLVKTAELLKEQIEKNDINDPSILESLATLIKSKIHFTRKEKEVLNPEGAQNSFVFSLSGKRNRFLFSGKVEKEISNYDKAAKKAFESEKYQASKELFEMIDEIYPNYIPALCSLGILNLKEGEFQEAARYFRTALTMRHNEPFPYAQLMLSISLYHSRNLDSAALSFEKAINMDAKNPLPYLYLGNIAQKRKDFQMAEKYFLKAIQLDSSLPESYFNLAIVKISEGKFLQAEKFYSLSLDKGGIPNEEMEKLLKGGKERKRS